jgi:hypothetical protein
MISQGIHQADISNVTVETQLRMISTPVKTAFTYQLEVRMQRVDGFNKVDPSHGIGPAHIRYHLIVHQQLPCSPHPDHSSSAIFYMYSN